MSRDGFDITNVSKTEMDTINALGGVLQDVTNRSEAKTDAFLIAMHSDIIAAKHIDMITAILMRVDQTGLIKLIEFELNKRSNPDLFIDLDDPEAGKPNRNVVVAAAANLQFFYKTIIHPLQVINARLQLLKFPQVAKDTPLEKALITEKDHSCFMQFKVLLDCYEACLKDEASYAHEMKYISYMLTCLADTIAMRPLDAINDRLHRLKFDTIPPSSALDHIVRHEPDLRTFLQLTHLLDIYESSLNDPDLTEEHIEPLHSMIGCFGWAESFCPAMPLTPKQCTQAHLDSAQRIVERLISGTLYRFRQDTMVPLGKQSMLLNHYHYYFREIDRSQTDYQWPRPVLPSSSPRLVGAAGPCTPTGADECKPCEHKPSDTLTGLDLSDL